MPRFCGSGPEVARLSETLMDGYLAFARAGDPNVDALPEWPRYESGRRATMVLDADGGRVVELTEDPVREFWLGGV